MSCGGIDIDATPRQSERKIKKERREKIEKEGGEKREREKFRFVGNTVSEYR